MSLWRTLVVGGAGAVTLASLGGCVVSVDSQRYTTREERRFEVGDGPDVYLVTFNGAIDVRTWDRPEVLVEIEKRARDEAAVASIQVAVEHSGSRVQVEARRPDGDETFLGLGLRASRSARIVATVPRRANVMARTGDGSVRADRVEGRVELRTGGGTVSGSDLRGVVTIQTDDGAVTLQNLDGAIDVGSGDGGVSVAGRFDAVHLRTDDGSITLRAERGSSPRDEWTLSTGDGSVVLYLPEPFDAELDASTRDGHVTTDQAVSHTGGEANPGALRGRLGSGGRVLKVTTGDGNIHVRVS